MGFLNKIKAMKNAVTGGAATVVLECDQLSFTAPFTVVVKVTTESAPVKVNSVYLKIKGHEEIEVPDVDVVYDDEEEETYRRVEVVRAFDDTVNLEIEVAGAQELEANQSYEWKVDVELPSDAPAIYEGRYCQHTYSAFAGLDCFGNDPDSGWVELSD
jgi:hypothetical protein